MPRRDQAKHKEYMRQYRAAHREQLSQKRKAYYKAHREEEIAAAGVYKKEHPKPYSEERKAYMKQYNKQYHNSHKERIKANRRQYYLAHREEEIATAIIYQKENRTDMQLAENARAKRHHGIINQLKTKCQRCNESNPACLDFHHRDPDKKEMNISNALRVWSLERTLKEIAKCDILCSNCHRKEHQASKPKISSPSKQKRREWFLNLKCTMSCVRCGESNPSSIDFHHKDRTNKIGDIANLVRDRSLDIVIEEIAKCEALCSNCHRKLHWEIKNNG